MKQHTKFKLLVLVAGFIALLFTGCQPGEQAKNSPVYIPFDYQPSKDATLLKMIVWEQAGKIDSTDLYLSHANPNYRYQAIHPYTTPRYPLRAKKLHPMMTDSVPEVRQLAIYAVGQHANKESISYLQNAYNAWDSLHESAQENALILEAIGKCGARPQLEQLAGVSTFEIQDSILIKGQALGLFQLLLKGLYDDNSIATMTSYFFSPQYPLSIRQIGGYYLMRGKELKLDKHEFAFGKVLRSDEHFTLRANAAGVMANSGSNKYVNILLEQLDREKNDQVNYNILRALFNMPYSRVKSKVFAEVNNSNPVISQMAARFFLINGQPDDASQYWDKVKQKKLDPVTSAYFAAATAKNLPFYYSITRNAAITSIRQELKKADDPYTKAQLLQVLAELPEQVNSVVSFYEKEAHPVIKTQVVFSVQKAAQIAQKNKKYINTVSQAARRLFNTILQDQDAGALAAMAYVIRDSISTNFHDVFRKKADLINIANTLSLPKEIETYNEIAMLVNSYGDQSIQPVKANKFSTFNPTLYSKITDNTYALVQTSAGDFTIEFNYKESPISVQNFIDLATKGYFTDKAFHRVVPNFVIQTGCSRGDGYSSLDYVIRSELGPLHYDVAGKVGMASAGNDTESSQWFVTHLPVFHLDGRYTIFGQVTSGMEVVHAIKMGDKINSIDIVY
jgi:cyclophilin family peptidyl-prolyl cis-trans isomerase